MWKQTERRRRLVSTHSPCPQNCIDWNRDVLKRELGLDDDDIIDLPILFKLMEDNRAVAYYPDMVRAVTPKRACVPWARYNGLNQVLVLIPFNRDLASMFLWLSCLSLLIVASRTLANTALNGESVECEAQTFWLGDKFLKASATRLSCFPFSEFLQRRTS